MGAGRLRSRIEQAVTLHRRAAALFASVDRDLDLPGPTGFSPSSVTVQRDLARRLAAAAHRAAPGWLGAPLDEESWRAPAAAPQDQPPTTAAPSPPSAAPAIPATRAAADETAAPVQDPVLVRVGTALPLPDATFPLLVPMIGAGHLAVDGDPRDGRVAALVQNVVLRLLATVPGEELRVLVADLATMGTMLGPVRQLVDAGALPPPVTDRDGVRAVLDEAERQVRDAGEPPATLTAPPGAAGTPGAAGAAGTPGASTGGAGEDLGGRTPCLLVVLAVPRGVLEASDRARLQAVAHAGPGARVHLLAIGQPAADGLSHATTLALAGDGDAYLVAPGGTESTVRIAVDRPPAAGAVDQVLAVHAHREPTDRLARLLPTELWKEASSTGLTTPVGEQGRRLVTASFDDTTPHWLVGGRSGAGKTAFLVNVLYGLSARYGPDELALYLLDFKEGVSFTEFAATDRDPSWIPQARAIGIESDRDYGVAVLRLLDREMTVRSGQFKRAGVTRLADLPAGTMPRVVCVVDEFQVLFSGTDRLSREAVTLLESVARKGRSYGIHLVLASQTVGGVEALYGKRDSIFGQFALRVALPGGEAVTRGASPEQRGEAVLNAAAGTPGHDQRVSFPDPHAEVETLGTLRHALWQARPAGSEPPAVFEGYAEQIVFDDPTYRSLDERRAGRKLLLVGRQIEVGSPTAAFALDASPGRHLATLGTSEVAADIVTSAVLGLARQHEPGDVLFQLVPLVAAADPMVESIVDVMKEAGHRFEILHAARLPVTLQTLADPATDGATPHTYLVIYGADAASSLLDRRDPQRRRSGLDDLRTVLRAGPARGVHVLGWWRALRRFTEDLGGISGRDDVACLVALNVPSNELAGLLGRPTLDHPYRPDRALFVDRHADRVTTIVPFVRPGRYATPTPDGYVP